MAYDAPVSEETPTGRLRQEHQLILQVAGVLDDIVTATEGGADFDFGTADRCISFFRLFVDAFHHGKGEEACCSRSWATTGLPPDGGPIAVMLAEHGEDAPTIGQMAGGHQDARGGNAAAGGAAGSRAGLCRP